MWKLYFFSHFLLLLSCGTVYGQACCSGGTPLSGSLGLQQTPGGTAYVGLIYDYNTQGSLVTQGRLLDDNPRARNTHSVLLRAGYGLSDRWLISALCSWVQQQEVIERPSGSKDERHAQGIGDAVLFAQYTLFSQPGYSLLLGAGTEVPLGSTLERDALTGLPYHPDLQPGRGAWSFLGSSKFAVFLPFRPTLSFDLQLTYRLAPSADRYEGLQAYQFGEELRLLGGLADRFSLGGIFVDPSVQLLYRRTGRDRINGLPASNTGGHWLHLRPGLQLAFSPALQLSAFVEAPLWWRLQETQLTTSLRARLSLMYSFEAFSKEQRPARTLGKR